MGHGPSPPERGRPWATTDGYFSTVTLTFLVTDSSSCVPRYFTRSV